jgi:DNA repair protein RadD
MILRPYQLEAAEAVYRHLRDHDDSICAVIPTAGGKTPIIATICKDVVGRWRGRALIVAHVKELLEQVAEKLHAVCPEIPFGIYSAGLDSRDTMAPVIIAGVQSAYRRGSELGHFDIAIIDEAHMIPPDGEGMYRTLIHELKKINPLIRVIGFTATPYRMKYGSICGPDNILNTVCYEIGVRTLIDQKYLCPLVSKAGRQSPDFQTLQVRGGEFIASDVEDLMDSSALVETACREILNYARDRHSVLIFASGVEHGEHIRQTLTRLGAHCRTVFGDTFEFDRAQTLADFKSARLKFLVNVNVLTTGFDAPNIDCVAILRPTLSAGLFYQMVGRGFRLHPSKQNCLVLDFGGNVLRHGPVDAVQATCKSPGSGIAPTKVCPECCSFIAAGFLICPDCGHMFAGREVNKHDATATDAGILTGQISTTSHPVQSVRYAVHRKRGMPDNTPKTLRVEYRIGFNRWQSEWICFEHQGFARQKSEQWWLRRSHAPVPDSAEEAAALANAGALCKTTNITIRSVSGEEFDRISEYELGEKPAWENVDSCDEALPLPAYVPADDGIPF